MTRARIPFPVALLLVVSAAGLLAGCSKKRPVPTCPVPTIGHPTVLNLGSSKVQPSLEMMPMLESLKNDFHGKLTVATIDLEEQEALMKRFDVKQVPMQIFFDAYGVELFRHEGPWTREAILAKWNELGVALDRAPGPPTPPHK
jgi:thioredoxin 1